MPEQYQSALTGPQMDQALLDMANHTSERYAKGTANGAAVPSGTAGYHDNALYYKDLAANQAQTATNAAGSASNSATAASTSEANATTAAGTATSAATTATQQADRAEDAAGRAEAIVGGQFVSYGQNQGLTPTQQAQARKNIVAGGTNPNLLDNWWFGPGVINQRGATSGTNFNHGVYRMDRWQTTYSTSAGTGSWSLGPDGLTITTENSAGFFRQRLSNFGKLTGKKLTFSIMYPDGTIVSKTIVRNSAAQDLNPGITGIVAQINADDYVVIGVNKNNTFTFKAVKLEIGNVSTLVNDAPPDPAEELAKCQRYFFRLNAQTNVNVLGFGNAGNGVAIFLIPTPTTMRTTPTVTVTNIGNLQIIIAGTTYTPTAISIRNAQANGIMITATCSSVSGADLALLRATASGAKLDFSADL